MVDVLSINIDNKIGYLLKEIIINNNFPSQEKLLKVIIPNNDSFMNY
ncbi:MAG: hypothetical protein ACOCV1_07045 [Bacillota bacterium]